MQRYRYIGAVLESPQHGPQLVTFVLSSLPPQGVGPDVIGWDWAGVEAESVNGTTWGEYEVVGTFTDNQFTVTDPPRPAPRHHRSTSSEPDFSIPCPAPAGGWRPVDLAKTTQAALDAAFAFAASAAEDAGAWTQTISGVPNVEGHDPTDVVLCLKCAGDPDAYERRIREVWGGALCVSQVKHSMRELQAIQDALHDDLDRSFFSDIDIPTNQVTAECFLVTDELRRRIDAKYGAGTVVLSSWLKPVDG